MKDINVRAMAPDPATYRFVRGGTVDINVNVRVYNEASQRIGAGSGVVSSTAVSLADLLGGTLPDGVAWFSISYRSSGAATTMLYETGANPDAYSDQVAVQASTGSYDTLVGGRPPLS